MKKLVQFSSIIVLVIMCSMRIHGAEEYEDSMTVEFSDPSKPGIVKVFYGIGDITVTGYDGKEVIIKTKSEIENLVNPPEDEKAKGLKRISGTSFYVASIEDENAVVVTRSLKDEVELLIQVPFKTSLIIGGGDTVSWSSGNIIIKSKSVKMNIPPATIKIGKTGVPFFGGKMGRILEGDVIVNNVSGEMEINTIDGDITLQEISGNVVAHSVDGDLLITFKYTDKEKPMSLSTVDGDIDVKLPADIKADLTVKTVDGDIYTDFDMDIVRKPEVEKKKDYDDDDSLYPSSIPPKPPIPPLNMLFFFGAGNNISAKINGGGPEIQMTTIDGNIYIRKGE